MADPLVSSPIPDSSSYAGADVNAMNAYNNALARINQQRMATLQQYGYTGTVDPTTGTISGVGVNPNDPYGNLQMLLHDSALQSQQDQNVALSRGLHGGLANQAITADKYAFGNQSKQLGTALESALSDLQGQQDDAAYARDSALYTAEQQAAQSAIDSGSFDTPDYSGVDVPGYGDIATQPVTTAPGQPKVAPALRPNPARDKLVQSLLARHVAPATWAKNNPQQAKKLGISPKTGGNVVIIRQLLKKKGGR